MQLVTLMPGCVRRGGFQYEGKKASRVRRTFPSAAALPRQSVAYRCAGIENAAYGIILFRFGTSVTVAPEHEAKLGAVGCCAQS